MGFIYQTAIKNSFEKKVLNKIKKELDSKLKKDNILVTDNIFIGFSYGNYHGTNLYYESHKNEQKAKFIKNILKNNQINIRCFSNLNMEYDIEILLGYADNKKEKSYIKQNLSKVIQSFYKVYSITENGIYICS